MTLPGWFTRFLTPQPVQEPLAVVPECTADPEPPEDAPGPFLAHPALDLTDLYPTRDLAPHHSRSCWICHAPGVSFCPERTCRRGPKVSAHGHVVALSIEGNCSVFPNAGERKVEVVCKLPDGRFIKHAEGLSDNVTWFSQQLSGVDVSTMQYAVIFKPEALVPDIQ